MLADQCNNIMLKWLSREGQSRAEEKASRNADFPIMRLQHNVISGNLSLAAVIAIIPGYF